MIVNSWRLNHFQSSDLESDIAFRDRGWADGRGQFAVTPDFAWTVNLQYCEQTYVILLNKYNT